jgi:hypothetical protein
VCGHHTERVFDVKVKTRVASGMRPASCWLQMPNRLRIVALALVAAGATACTSGAPTASPWTLYTPGPLATPQPTLAPTPAPSPTDEPIAEDTPPPPDCPSHEPASPMRVTDLFALEPLCIGPATITVIGYEAPMPGMGWEGPAVVPGWLVYPTTSTSSALWQATPTAARACTGFPRCPYALVHIAPGSSLTFTAKGRWVKVTGHIADPASATCHYEYPADSSQLEKLPDSDAQRWCSEGFVIEQVEVTTAP